MAEEVKLFGTWASPFSHRVEIALQLKGVQYEVVQEDLSNKSDLLLKYNPVHKKIPVLLHNGKPICESLVILEYIDETWEGTPILPADPYERAMARFWANFIDEKYPPALQKAICSSGKEQDAAMEEGCELLKALEKELKNKRFFGGDSIGLVDIAASFVAYWAPMVEEAAGVKLLTGEKFPTLSKWINEYVNCSVIKSNLPPRDQLFTHVKARVQLLSAANIIK